MTKDVFLGASRGIGLGLVHKYLALPGNVQVVATSRDPANAKALQDLSKVHPTSKLLLLPLDVNSEEAYPVAVKALADQGVHHVDILIANAGIGGWESSFLKTTTKEIKDIFDTNVVGVFLTLRYFTPLVQASQHRLVVVMSSILGSIAAVKYTGFFGSIAPYRVSKTALNMLIASYLVDSEVRASNIRAISLHPGWVQTELGGDGAQITVDQSTDGIVNVLERALTAGTETAANEEYVRRLESDNLVYVDYAGAVMQW